METGPGSLTAPRPNPDLVTVPLTAHPPVHPPLRSGPPLVAGSRPLALSPRRPFPGLLCPGAARGPQAPGKGAHLC